MPCPSQAGLMSEPRNFLELNPCKVKDGTNAKYILAQTEPKHGLHLSEETKIPCQSNEFFLSFFVVFACMSINSLITLGLVIWRKHNLVADTAEPRCRQQGYPCYVHSRHSR